MAEKADHIWMQRALSLAAKAKGYTAPNPMVGCVVVSKEGEVIGEGYHERAGKAHAEVNAVEAVSDREKLEGAVVYVTLEPCSHHGKTPPCADMLAALPLQRVVIAMKDPTRKVNGKGIARLRKAGFEVEVGLLEEEAEKLNEAWLHFLATDRPFVTLKIAQTADGYIAAPDGMSKWISCKESRKRVHRWRAENDAVMVGRQTAETDNPSLTVRDVEGRQPRRVVIDGPLDLQPHLNLLSDQYEEKTIIITYQKEKAAGLGDPMLNLLTPNYFRGETIVVDRRNGHTDLRQAMKELAKRGIHSILVEGGQQLSTALLRQGLADRLQMFIAPKLLGGGTKSVLGLGLIHMEDVRPFDRYTWTQVGSDMLLTADL